MYFHFVPAAVVSLLYGNASFHETISINSFFFVGNRVFYTSIVCSYIITEHAMRKWRLVFDNMQCFRNTSVILLQFIEDLLLSWIDTEPVSLYTVIF